MIRSTCFVTACATAMAQSAASSAIVTSDATADDRVGISAASVNGVPPVVARTMTGPGMFASVTATSTSIGSASASAYSTRGERKSPSRPYLSGGHD
jgi:hypothetical protein